MIKDDEDAVLNQNEAHLIFLAGGGSMYA